MKKQRKQLLVVAVIIIAGFSIAARSHDDRPASIPAERWIAIGDKVGFALSPDKDDGSSVAVDLYFKTNKGWRRGRIENPASILPMIQQ